MAAALRNNVWVAPGQDAQFLHTTTAPLTADGLRGEDHGQVLCNTRDAIPGTFSFHDYNLVGNCIFFFSSCICLRASQWLLMPAGFHVKRQISRKDVSLILEAGRPVCLCVVIFTAIVPQHVTENSL